ncbi:MAG: sugar transferase, partial [Cetobacterium sp.]
QPRVGENEKEFLVYKFRSMSVDAEKDGAKWAQKNDPRVTKFGNFMRKTRIDELPQLFNVIKGDMSFIGPRPERMVFIKELEKTIPYYGLRHMIKPGLTGWAQVMYPYGATVEDAKHKLEYDLYYIKCYNLFLDLVILFKTLKTVLFGKGR